MEDFSDDGFQDMAEALMSQGRGSTVPARFYVGTRRDDAKSSEKGREIHVDVDMIEIRVGKDIINREPTDEDKRAYAKQWAAFKAGQDQEKVEGTPLNEFAPLSAGERETLKYAGIRTVEQFAATPDTTLQGLGPLMNKRQAAAIWLKKAAGAAQVSQVVAENQALKVKLETLERMLNTQAAELAAVRNGNPAQTSDGSFAVLAEMQKQMAALQAKVDAAPAPRRRGRPPKHTNGTEG